MKSPIENNQKLFISNDEVDLKTLFQLLITEKILIVIITAIFALSSVFYALSITNIYRSEAILSVINKSTTQPSNLSRFDSVAAMAGLTLPQSNQDKGTLALATITSRAFLQHLLTFEDISPSIMAVKSYDEESQLLSFDKEIYNTEQKSWAIKGNESLEPSYLKVYKNYLGQLSVSKDRQTGFIFISYDHMSPVFAKHFLDLIISETNTLLRQKDLQESADALEYLTSIIGKTSLVDMKSSIGSLIERQLETQMMAKITTDYVLKSIEPPFIPENRVKPDRVFICMAGTLLGAFIGIIFVIVRHILNFNRENNH